MEQRGNRDAAHTLNQNSGQVFRYGIQTGRCERNPMLDLRGALEPVVVKHMPAVLEPEGRGASAGLRHLQRSAHHQGSVAIVGPSLSASSQCAQDGMGMG